MVRMLIHFESIFTYGAGLNQLLFFSQNSNCHSILSAALSQHLLGFEIAQLEFHHLH